MGSSEKFIIKCGQCRRDNIFDQPFCHAGVTDEGFLYSDSGHFTLTWNWQDPVIEKFFLQGSRYSRDAELRQRFEQALPAAPDGGRWRAENPARCIYCRAPISGSMLETIEYLLYQGSIQTQVENYLFQLKEYLNDPS